MHRVHLRDFEGPLDLLLFFIRRDEVDVYDIPIARIADEYLEAVRLMQRLDLDEAAEFIYTAALLIQIKARMLLPRPPAEDGEEPEDPRAELVQRLLEYIQYREAGAQIGEAVAGQARPPIVNGPELRDTIHRTKINLYLHTWTVHHPRLYDTAAAGGALLVGRVDEQYGLDNVFTPEREVDTFGSIAELKRKLAYYLDHPERRITMGRRAAERVARDHTMQHRMTDLVETLKQDG